MVCVGQDFLRASQMYAHEHQPGAQLVRVVCEGPPFTILMVALAGDGVERGRTAVTGIPGAGRHAFQALREDKRLPPDYRLLFCGRQLLDCTAQGLRFLKYCFSHRFTFQPGFLHRDTLDIG